MRKKIRKIHGKFFWHMHEHLSLKDYNFSRITVVTRYSNVNSKGRDLAGIQILMMAFYIHFNMGYKKFTS